MKFDETLKNEMRETFNDWITVKEENSIQLKRVNGSIKELAEKMKVDKPNLMSAFRLAKMKKDKGQNSLDVVSTLSELI